MKRRWFTVGALIALSACDGHTYEGRTAEENRQRADAMPLPDAYVFYVRTYKGTSPPMLDVAATFRRFGQRGTRYIVEKALQTRDTGEFDATNDALLVLGYRCSMSVTEALEVKRAELGAESTACSSRDRD